MNETEAMGVECQARRIGTAVAPIAEERISGICEMCPDLMKAPRIEDHLDEGTLPYNAPTKNLRPRLLCARASHHGSPATRG